MIIITDIQSAYLKLPVKKVRNGQNIINDRYNHPPYDHIMSERAGPTCLTITDSYQLLIYKMR